MAFATSGQSGVPAIWLRTDDQLRAEAELLARTVVGRVDRVDRVVNFAPPHHLYGRLFGDLLPAHLGVPVQQAWQNPLAPPDLPAGEHVLLVCLPATWVMLRSLADRLAAEPGVLAVHSTGPTTAIARQLIRALDGTAFSAVEILGSTETGAIAHRTLAPRPVDASVWTLFDDVTLVHDAVLTEQRLRVSSPRLARPAEAVRQPATLALDDLVRPAGGRRFELLGRATRMIKVNGRRIRLDHVEEALRVALPDADVVCVPRVDSVRAEFYDLFYADAPGRTGPGEVQAHLVAALPGVPLPRRVHRVALIPRSATGKVRLDRLLASAGSR